MFDFLTSIPPEWIAIALFFLASMQGASGQSWLATLVAKLQGYVTPANKTAQRITLFRRDGEEFVPDREAAPAATINLQNIMTLVITILPLILPLIQGCGKTQAVESPPAAVGQITPTLWEAPITDYRLPVTDYRGANAAPLAEEESRAGSIVNLGAGGIVGTALPLAWVSGDGHTPWAWAAGEAVGAGAADRRGPFDADAGASGAIDLAGVPAMGCDQLPAFACSTGVCGPSGRPAVARARPVARLRGSGWYPGKRIVRAAGCVARAVGRLRLPGRPIARLLGRR